MNHPEVKPFIHNTAPTIAGARHFTHEAMATVFELYVEEEDAKYAEQAAQAAFAEVDRLEQELSRFIENSDVSRLNNCKANQEVDLDLDTFQCLVHAQRIYEQTKGAFDITVGALYTCWLNKDKTLRTPAAEELALARQQTGMNKLQLNPEFFTARVLREGVQIDLGGIGKGYAADKVAELLREWNLTKVLILAGASSVLALDPPSGKMGWPVTLSYPLTPHNTLARFHISELAVSGSGQRQGRHIIDPRPDASKPVKSNLASWAIAPDAVTADALSTAFMVMNPEEIRFHCLAHPNTAAMIAIAPDENRPESDPVLRFGRWPKANL